MNIYYVQQFENQGYDTFDSFVVIAESDRDARYTDPEDLWRGEHKVGQWDGKQESWDTWTSVEHVKVTKIGVALPSETARIVCASFNAG